MTCPPRPRLRCSVLPLAFLAAAAAALAGPECVIQKRVEPPHTGSIQLVPDKASYAVGEKVTVTAVPRGRFRFHEWGGGIPPSGPNPFPSFEVCGHGTIVATFRGGYLAERPLLSPRQEVYYLGHPRDLWFHVHQNGHRLLAVEKDGQPVPFEQSELQVEGSEPLPDSLSIRIDHQRAAAFGPGRHRLSFAFEGSEPLEAVLQVMGPEESPPNDLKIVSFYVDHGTSVLLMLPNGETLMVDTGTRPAAESFTVPFLKQHLPVGVNGKQRIDHVFITHWHYDHFQGLGALLEHFEIGNVRYNLEALPSADNNYQSRDNPNDPYGYGRYGFAPTHWEGFKVGNRITDIGGVEILVLNAAVFDESDDRFRLYRPEHYEGYFGRNNRSLSFRLSYNGFVYTHGGDIYQHAQRAILHAFPDQVRAHVYHGNHHFHGGVDLDYLLATEPVLFLASANSSVYDRDAFSTVVMNQAAPALERSSRRFRETLLSFEVGHQVIRVDGSKDWSNDTTELHYETHQVRLHPGQTPGVPHLRD
jgi:beta-lactamase superfamily II metal-dependent hydrolase